MEQSFQKGVVLHLASLIEYTEGGVISKQLIKVRQEISLYFFGWKGEGLANIVPRLMRSCRYWKGSEYYCKRNSVHRKAGESIVFPANAPCPYSSGEI